MHAKGLAQCRIYSKFAIKISRIFFFLKERQGLFRKFLYKEWGSKHSP